MTEYWVHDRGGGYSDVTTENGVLTDVSNKDIDMLFSWGNVVHLPDCPLSRPPTFWRRLLEATEL